MKKSLYDMHVPANRRGFSGWKLTKRPFEDGPQIPEENKAALPFIGRAPSVGKKQKRNKRYGNNNIRSNSKLNNYDQQMHDQRIIQ